MTYFLGIDVSTTATKALLIDEGGRVVGVAASGYSFESPRPLWSEQDPALWWEGALASIRDVLASAGITGADVGAVGLTGQMHGLVLLDEAGEVLRPAILWNDQRTAAQCDAIRERVGRRRLIEISGNDALTGFTAPKILWVRDHEPHVYARVAHVLLPKDFVRYRLTGDHATDRAGGSGTILFDLDARTWSDALLDLLDLPKEWFPPTHEGPEITGTVSAAAAGVTGLAAGTPVVAGGGDQAAQAVGVGAIEPGVVALTLGTSGVIFAPTRAPLIEPEGRLHAFCHALPDRWHLMGVMLSAAGSLQWYRDRLAPEVDFDILVDEASEAPAGSGGLLFLPYLTGERTPHPDPLARGAWVGLTVRHGRAEMTRALLEGVAFGLRDSFELLREAGLEEIREVRVSGGGAKSALWRQILADVLGSPLVTVNSTEGAAYGAALLAATGAGHFADVATACDTAIRRAGEVRPGPDRDRYDTLYPTYRSLYPALRESFGALSAVDAG